MIVVPGNYGFWGLSVVSIRLTWMARANKGWSK